MNGSCIYRFIALCFPVFALPPIVPAQGLPGAEFRDPLPLYYDVRTGNVTIDTTNVTEGLMAGYGWRVPCNGACDRFETSNFTPFMGSQFATAEIYGVAETNLSGTPGGVYSLGSILPAGLSEEEFRDVYFSVEPLPNSVISRTQYYVIGPAGSGTQHLLQPFYMPTPFPAINDGSVGPTSTVVQWASEAMLRYDSITGGLEIDTNGAVFSYEIQFSDSLVKTEAFLPAHPSGFGTSEVSDNRILEVGWEGIPAGNHLLGAVLPTGLTESEFESLIDSAQFLGELGHDVASFDIQSSGINMNLRFVPEPAGNYFVGFLLLMLPLMRRTQQYQ